MDQNIVTMASRSNNIILCRIRLTHDIVLLDQDAAVLTMQGINGYSLSLPRLLFGI